MDFRSILFPTLALGMILVAASLGMGEDADQGSAQEPSGVRLVSARCVFCHGPTTTVAFSRRLLDTGGEAALDTFLAGHHAPDAEARASIVNFLSRAFGGQE